MNVRVGDLCTEAFTRLKDLAECFDTGTQLENENLFGLLVSIQCPGLPESLSNARIEYDATDNADDPFSALIAETSKIDTICDFLARNERYDWVDMLSELSNEIKDASINQDGKLK